MSEEQDIKESYDDTLNAKQILNEKFDEMIAKINERRNTLLLTIDNVSNTKLKIEVDTDDLYALLNKTGVIHVGDVPKTPQIQISSIEERIFIFTFDGDKLNNEDTANINILPITFCESKHSKNNINKIDWITTSHDINIGAWTWRENACSIQNLEASTEYIIQIRLKNKIGWSEWSEISKFKTSEPPLIVRLINHKIFTGKKRKEKEELDDVDTNIIKFDVNTLRIGDKCDIEDNWNVWFEGEIIEIDKEKGLKISFLNWSQRYDEWLKFDEYERFNNLNERTLKFEEMKQIENKILSQPKHYISNIDGKDYFVMICNNQSIMRYDVFNDKYDVLCKDKIFNYDNNDDLQSIHFPTSMDTVNNIFYIVHNINDIGSFDVDNKKWIKRGMEKEEVITTKTVKKSVIVFIPHSNNTDNNYHYIYSTTCHHDDHFKYYNDIKCDKIKVYSNELMTKCSEFIYCPTLHGILMISEQYDNKTYTNNKYEYKWGYLQLNDEYRWKSLKIDMIYTGIKCYVLGFDHLLFVFDSTRPRSIYCWDISTNKYYECNKRIPKTTTNKAAKYEYGLSCNNYAHLYDIENSIHIKFNLYQLIPNQLYQYYSNHKIVLLVSGYLRRIQTKFDYIIPHQLLHIINNLYPIFL